MKKRVLSALLALCLTLSLAGAAFAENEPSGDSTSAVSQAVSSVESEPQTQDETVSSGSASGEDQTAAKTESTPAPTETPAASDVAEEEPESAASEVEVEISTAETAQESSYPAQDFEAEVEGAEFVVNVSAPEGALPEDVTLTASLVGSSEDNADDQAVADVAAELDDADVEYDGFVALDISFVDADGNKVEPLQPVSVNFTLPAELLPEDVDSSTLEVQHLKENEAGEVEEVETVADTADATEGTVTVDASVAIMSENADTTLPVNAAVSAEFEVDGFSTFTITWKQNQLFGEEKTEKISFSIRDTDGNLITLDEEKYPDNELTFELNNNNQISFDELIRQSGVDTITDVNGQEYHFKNATFISNGMRYPLSMIKRQSSTSFSRKIILYSAISGSWTRDDNLENDNGITGESIELIYERAEDSSTVVYNPEPEYTETVTPVQDQKGVYQWKLTVSGDVAAAVGDGKQKVDVLFIVDQSSNMQSQLDYVANAVHTFADQLQTTMDARFAVVGVGDKIAQATNQSVYQDAAQWQNWTSDAGSVVNAIKSHWVNSSDMNYEAGVMSGRSAMFEARPDSVKYVIFLSNTKPNRRYSGNGTTIEANEQQSISSVNGQITTEQYKYINGFFAIDLSGNIGTSLDQMVTAARQNVSSNNINQEFFWKYSITDGTDLNADLSNIENLISTFAFRNVTITAKLEDYAAPVKGAQVEVYQVTDEGEEQIDAFAYDSISGINYSLLNGEQLNKDATYELRLNIEPTDLAYLTYSNSEQYPDIGESNTGVNSSKQSGFFIHKSQSTLVYYDTLQTGARTKYYAKPVIQVLSTSLTINKVIENLDKSEWNDAAELITFYVKTGSDTIAAIALGTNPPQGANYTITETDTGYQVVVSGLTVYKTYTVEENCEKLTGYIVDNEITGGGSLMLNKDGNIVDVTNSYTPEVQELTVIKKVTGTMGSKTEEFNFTLSLTKTVDGQDENYEGDTLTAKKFSADGSGTPEDQTLLKGSNYGFSLQDGQKMVIEVPFGYTATISEDAKGNGYTTYTWKDTEDESGAEIKSNNYVEMTSSHTVYFKNHRDPVAPTGLEDNHTKPFGLMIGIAVLAGMALVGGAVVRRRRRWME